MTNFYYSIIFFLLLCTGLKCHSQNPEVNGQWSDPITFNLVPVAVANLPDGRLLTWSSKSRLDFGGADGFTFTQIFDPSIGLDGAVLDDTVSDTNHDMFCPGINNLADGRIMATGGSSTERTSIYDPKTGTWTRADDMNIGRGYQGSVTLSDGSAFLIGGSWSGGEGNKDAEIWTEELGWRVLTGLNKELLWNDTDDAYEVEDGSYRLDNHAWLFAAPNGKIFHAGPGETMHWFDVTGTGSSTVVGQRGDDIYAMNGTTVMFDVGKILKFGGSYTYSGGTPSSDNAYVIDFNNENDVTVTATANNAEEGRIYTTGVVLPNGEVLILGGMETSVVFSDAGAHLSAEMYNPTTNTFRTLSSMQVPRTYHSAGILLNDGRVFMGGGGLCGNNCPENHTDAEIFSPPYLFDSSGDLAARPTISAPDSAFYLRDLPVVTSPDVTEFAFIRMSSATHSVNNEQRRIPITSFTGSNGTYQLNMPDANVMPPGYYMLFALNADGVPSISEAVLVGAPEDRIMEANLLVEFDFFEGNGALLNDTSGNNNNGEIKQRDNNGNEVALSADYWNEDGFLGNSLQMDGFEFSSNSIVEIPPSPSLQALTDEITVMAWVNRNTGSIIPQNGEIPNVAIFTHDYDSFFFGYHNSLFKFYFLTDSGVASCFAGEYTPGEWEHVVGTYDGTIARLYVNGQQICSDIVSGNFQINTVDPIYNTFTLAGFYDIRPAPVVGYGNSSGITDELDGSMDKFKLYNVALSAQDIQDIYLNELGIDIDVELEDNLAFNQPTLQSSTGYGGDSFKAVDGNTNGFFDNNDLPNNSVTHTAVGDNNAWWRVDLGDTYEYDLTAIRIFNRDNEQQRLSGATVYIGNIDSNDPNDYIEVGELSAIQVQMLTQNLGVARYVMVRQNGILSLAEVQVFGDPINCPLAGTPCDDGDSTTSNDVESGDCNCAGTVITCENLEIVYDINGESGSGDTEITVTEGDDITLSINLEDVTMYTVTDPNGVDLSTNANTINDIAINQSGLYTVTTILDESQQSLADPVLVSADSEEQAAENGSASNVLDGNPNTYWHTEWSTAAPPHNHHITFDMGPNSYLSGLKYLPRQNLANGRINEYKIFVSNTNTVEAWANATAVSMGFWPNNADLQTVNFPSVILGRYVRLVALSEVNGQPWTSAAEIDVIRTGPTAIYVDSEQTGEEGLYAVDGDPNTYWHTQYSIGSGANNTVPPHEIHLDLGLESNVSGLEYLPRQDIYQNGTIAQYEIYVSNSTTNWGTAVDMNTWDNDKTLKTASFPVTQGRYVRLRALTEVNGNAWTSAAEINIIRTVTTECVKTIQINVDTATTYTYENNIDGWSPSDPNNAANFNDEIIVENGNAEISANIIVDNVTVNAGAALTVNTGTTLTTNTMTLKSTSQLYSSLIADGIVEGTVKYERFTNANAGGNDLISPPLSGETWADFLLSDTNASDILDDGNMNPTTYAFGPFDKTTDWYINFSDAESSDLTLVSGRGYRAGTDVGTTLTFTGTVPITPITVDIINTGAEYPEWNLIGNPYPSYIDMDLFLKHVLEDVQDPGSDIRNIDILEDISGIYGYAGSLVANKWEVITLANSSGKLMAPGQGFFVAADAASVEDFDIAFDTSMRTIGGIDDDDFIVGRNANELTFLKLNVNTTTNDYGTEFYFNSSSSLGLDLGYDGKILGNVAPNFAIYSHLVEDNSGLPLALQALSLTDLTNTLVPLGVNSNQGEQITFSISESTLPGNVEVYLEDIVTNTITLLNSGDYTFTPNTDLNGTGRFYLRFSSTTLSVVSNQLDYLQIYTTDNPKLLVIKGELSTATMVNLYDIQGRLVLNKKLNHFDVLNTLDIATIGTGVYIVKVFNDNQSKTQKLVIK